MNDDEQLGAVLHRAVSTLEPPTERLVAGGIARGRRLRRLVRGVEWTSGAAVVAALVALIVALVPGSAGSPRGTTAVGGRSDGPAAGSTTVAMTPQALLRTALDTLPRPGATSAYEGSASPGLVGAGFVYDDGHGAARVSVSLGYPPSGGANLGAACDISACITRADGSKLAIYQGNGHPGSPNIPGKDWEVTLLRTDGVVVSITEWNSPQEKSAGSTRTDPPFTVAELTEWVGKGEWQVEISAHQAAVARPLFTPIDAATAAQKQAQAAQRQAADREKAAELARERAQCAVAKAAHRTLPGFCATIK